MKAVILAGGMGKRLKPITDYVPKPLIPIHNIPIIEWQILYFKKFGVTSFVICTGYKNEHIADYLDSRNLGVKINYSIEKTPLGTGGAIKNASRFIDDKIFFVINGDVITNLDLKLLQAKPNSIAVIPLKTAVGVVDIDENKIRKFREKSPVTGYWMNAGVYCLSKDIIKYLPKKGNIENTTFSMFATKGRLYAIKYDNIFWHSIDSHKDIEECTKNMDATNYVRFIYGKNTKK